MTPALRELAMKWDINGRWVGIDHVVAQALLDVAEAADRAICPPSTPVSEQQARADDLADALDRLREVTP